MCSQSRWRSGSPRHFFFNNFLLWTIFFNIFIGFVTILLLFYVLVFWREGMWDLSSPTRDQTCTLCLGRPSFNHWTTREVPSSLCNLRKVPPSHPAECSLLHPGSGASSPHPKLAVRSELNSEWEGLCKSQSRAVKLWFSQWSLNQLHQCCLGTC